ncbi:C3a anaphylatoxin chemotactic receptor [Sceloporus undulatus]|uniref:C3a anaphylatoxin chemotactic receptor n=1 Tax=Sceloporus undulatus TaxID=8520 RepID=UPI001C4B1243|nr:C3a anaphylatoxin chemotactic receptor [Sceloporus undulatus]XP_042322482.1 C3a anaphylatoxin chemotactic receptor [Sceloporus undulatus]
MPPLLANDSLDEYNESFELHYTPTSISSLIILSLTFLLGLPGNGLVIWIVTLKMQRTVNTVWFLHLAVADFVCCLTLPFTVVQLILHYHWPFGWFFCKIIPTGILLNMFASVFLLTTISIDRCLVVMKPVWCQNHRTVRLASGVCASIWFLAFAMCCPAFFYRETSVDEFGNSICVYNWYSEEYLQDEEVDDLVFSSDLFSIQHPTFMATGIPQESFTDEILDMYPKDQVLSMAKNNSKALHSSILNTVGIHQDTLVTDRTHPTSIFKFSQPQLNTATTSINPGSYSTNSSNLMEKYYYDYPTESQPPSVLVSITIIRGIFGFFLPFGIMTTCYALIAHKMLKSQFTKIRGKALLVILLLVATFFLCWVPYHIIGVLYLLATPNTEFYEELALWDHISTALAYVNSCTNPLLYVFVGKNFQEKARQTVLGIFEGVFSEEATCSTACSQDRSKTRFDKNTDVSVL